MLDVAGGTGDIAFRMYEKLKATTVAGSEASNIVVSDINPDMLAVGRDRADERGYVSLPSFSSRRPDTAYGPALAWQEANAEELPFEDNSFDIYTIAFGIRNVTNIPKALREARRVLKPGGRFMCLEFSHVEDAVLRTVYDAYSFHVIPKVGEIVAGDKESYEYLVESIRQFPNQEKFAGMIREAGFAYVRHENFTGGIVCVHSGFNYNS